MENQSLIRLRSIANFLKKSGRIYFQNFNLSIFLKSIQEDQEIAGIINNLLLSFSELEKKIEKIPQISQGAMSSIRTGISSFDEWVAFCVFYLKRIKTNSGNSVIDNFIVHTGNQIDDEGLSPKLQFYNDCIEPIIIYLELQLKQKLNAIHILQRYKVLCEWYDRRALIDLKEVEITQKHLSKFLFDQGFTYSLSETTVPSGRIDNFAISLGLKNKLELSNLPESIVVEGKIFDGSSKKVVTEVKNQILKRLEDLNFSEGYCIVYNKSAKQINLKGNVKFINGIPFMIEREKQFYFVIVNLHDNFFISKSTIESVEIDINNLSL